MLKLGLLVLLRPRVVISVWHQIPVLASGADFPQIREDYRLPISFCVGFSITRKVYINCVIVFVCEQFLCACCSVCVLMHTIHIRWYADVRNMNSCVCMCGSWYISTHVKFYNCWIWNSRSDWRLLERPYTTCSIYCHLLSVLCGSEFPCRLDLSVIWGIKVICCWVFQESQLGDNLIT